MLNMRNFVAANPAGLSDTVNMDLILVPWAKVHGLFVNQEFSEDENRFIQIVDDAGDSYSLWISAPKKHGAMEIIISENAVNGKRVPSNMVRSESLHTNLSVLGRGLSDAYRIVETWISERGHTRTSLPIF